MNDDEQHYTEEAIARCEARAKDRGHSLTVWYPVDERLHASDACEVCGAVGWVTRPHGEARWRIGGSALEQGCLRIGRLPTSGA